MSLRVLLLTSEFPPDIGGIASHVDELARGLVRKGVTVGVVYAQGFAAGPQQTEHDGIVVMRPRLFMGEPLYQVMLRRWLARTLSHNPADLLHVHGMRPLGATRRLPVPTIFTNHTSGFLDRVQSSPYRRRRTMRLLEHVSHVIGPSDELVDAARALGYAGPATMIANGVDPERFSPGASPLRRRLGIGGHEVVVLLARRLVDKNGVVWFARALGLLRDRAFRVVIAGDGPERGSMRAILSATGMLDRVVFLGAVLNTEMPAIYRAADVSVLPSLAEATSISGLEAMASGLPLVGTRVGGIPAIIEEGVTGYLVPPCEPEAMAAALGGLIDDADARRRLGAAARRKVEQEFAWPIIVDKTIAVYRSCLETAAR